jgi:hypothetical protein
MRASQAILTCTYNRRLHLFLSCIFIGLIIRTGCNSLCEPHLSSSCATSDLSASAPSHIVVAALTHTNQCELHRLDHLHVLSNACALLYEVTWTVCCSYERCYKG